MALFAAKPIKAIILAATLGLGAGFAAPLAAQDMQTVDPDLVIDGDLLGEEQTPPATVPQEEGQEIEPGFDGAYETSEPDDRYGDARPTLDLPPEDDVAAAPSQQAPAEVAERGTTYREDDLIGAAEGLFGEGAEGLARLIQDLLADQGEPNGYIVGREGGGAFILGVRYGSGTLYHAVEGNMPVYWTGPSIGFDAGANAGNTFVLVYNLHDTEDLYRRFPAGEGQAYFVGGFTASYVRRGDIVLIPIRVGAGLRLGVNAGYMRFSREHRWLPL